MEAAPGLNWRELRRYLRRVDDRWPIETAFLEYGAVYPAALHESRRFRAEFAAAYRRIAAEGPIAAMAATPAPEPTGGTM